MQGAKIQDLWQAHGPVLNDKQINPVKHLENSAHGWSPGECAKLIRDGFILGGELVAQDILDQRVNQQTQAHAARGFLEKETGSEK